MSDTVKERVRQVVAGHAGLSVPIEDLDDTSDLFAAGMTSFASVNLMLALEDAFDVEFPDAMLKRDVFGSIDSIAAAISTLTTTSA